MSIKSVKFSGILKILLVFILLSFVGGSKIYAQYYPVHATVQWPSPQSPYLSDYYSGSRDRLIVTLLNRDLQQPLLFAKLRIKIKSTGFLASSREEVNYPILELNANVPTRLTNIDLAPYLQPQNLQTNGALRNGQLPVGYTEFSVQVVDYYTGRVLSDWHTGRSYLDVKKPPLLNYPEKDAQIGITEPLYIRFQWMPRHQGLAGTEYEFVLKELPDNGAAPQSAFAYGNEIYRIRTRNTTLNYTHLEPVLFPNRRYAWQVQAIARDGVDEIGMFENGGFSEIGWFYLTDNCRAPTGLKARPRFAKADLSWNKVIGGAGYVVECRPKTKLNVYEWSNTRVAGETLTLAGLKPGWTYEWRVGTLCTGDRPVFSDVHEFTLSSQNDELLADCGKEPVRNDLSQEPNLTVRAGDVITIGGDYPMTITEAVSLGDGWYAGRGKTRLKTIIDAPVSLRFDRLRINVDNFQIDGTVEASYDENKAKIADLDYVDDGGKDIKPTTIRMREHKTDFTLPDIPQFSYNPKTGELETTDADGNPQTIKMDVPENVSYESIFPMMVTDNKGNTYQISTAEQNAEKRTDNEGEKEHKDEKIALNCERVDRVGDFNTESLSKKYGYIHFERGEGKYAFDDGKEEWYKKSVKTDRFYKPFTKGYIAPWKLVPSGETDVVTARYDGRKEIDLKKVRFVSEPNSAALPARLNETEMTWTISLRSVSTGTSYDVYALYEGEVIGKLRVVSYDKQLHKVTLIPINEVKLDKVAIEQELNTIYNPVGIQFTVDVDESMRGNYDWEVASEKDSLLSTVGKSFWGYDKELKESTEMLNLQKAYQQVAGTLDGAYLFVLNGATGLEGKKDGLLGEMPRKSRFGYIFAGNSPNTETLSHTIAHELGHGIFTLQHTFDYEYAGKKSQGQTRNLMDYDPKGKEIATFQWNIMAKPAIFTEMDKADEGQIIGTIARISGVNNGIAPNGQVISSIRATNPNNMVVPIIKQSSMFIVGFEIYDEAGSLVKTFNWNNTLDGYTTKANEKLDKSKDIEVIFNVAKENLVARIYEYHGDKCFYKYADVSYNPVRKQVLSTNYVWTTDYLWNANESCKASFIQQQILKRDRTECDSETIKSDKYRLSQINQQTTVKDIVSIVNSCCLNSLRTLDYKTISSFILQISSEKSIEDPDELALIRLMNALNGEDYPSFFNLLEANNNALIRKLVAEIDDASLLFWTGNNYTNFIGTLAWMFGVAPEYSVERWNNIDVSDAFGQVFNLYSQPFTNDIGSKNPWLTSLCEFRYSGRYNEETGRISIVREEKVLQQAPYGQVSIPVWTVVDEEVSDLSPLTPIVITTQKDLPLVEIALGGENVMSDQMYIVPAIFLKYRHDKIRNDYIEKGIITTFDVATIALSGGTALATKVHWVRRAWALAEVIGAIGNIAVNTQVASSPRVKEAVDIYNATMGLIGLKNFGQSGYKFVKNLPEQTKGLLQKSEKLRGHFLASYLNYRIAITKLKNSDDWAELSEEVRQGIIKQEKCFIDFADAKNIPNDKWGAPDNIFINGKTKQDILSIKKGERPAPETYLSHNYIREHLEAFEKEGIASRIVTRANYEQYGIGKPDVGKTEFVGRKSEIDDILKLPLSELSQKLGIPIEQLQGGNILRIDFKLSKKYRVTMPTGNEFGTNNLWIPGGKLPEGNSEAVIKTEGMIKDVDYSIKEILK